MGLRAWFKRGHHKMEPGTPLDDFVSSALAGISRGIRRANEDLRASGTITGNNFFLEPSGTDRLIEFDVAVTSKAEGGGKVDVVGASGSFALAKETVSRIKFVVHVKNWLG